MAVSVTVIVIAAVVIATILGLWWWRRRKRNAEEDEDDQQGAYRVRYKMAIELMILRGTDFIAPESSWR